MYLGFKLLVPKIIFSYKFSSIQFFKFSVIYLILNVDVLAGLCFIIFQERCFIHLNYQIFTPESKETKCSALIKF